MSLLLLFKQPAGIVPNTEPCARITAQGEARITADGFYRIVESCADSVFTVGDGGLGGSKRHAYGGRDSGASHFDLPERFLQMIRRVENDAIDEEMEMQALMYLMTLI